MVSVAQSTAGRDGSHGDSARVLHDLEGGASRRLWRPLARRPQRRRELKFFEKAGDWALGALKRTARRRSRIAAEARRVVALSDTFTTLSERAFDEEIETARAAARCGRRDDASRIHAFAVAREAIRRTIGLRLYVEQVMGAWVMEDGCLAEMLTGEGKTVTACLTAAVQAWAGHGLHVVTVNDYLARRDAEINEPVFRRLGLSVGVIQQFSTHPERREAYAKDITYTADQQLIFDYLRDRLHAPTSARLSSLLLDEMTDTELRSREVSWTQRVVQRGLYAAIIDEADSVLIDQATTPAIIGAGGGEDANHEFYEVAEQLASTLVRDRDYTADPQQFHVALTDAGRARLETQAHRLPAFWAGPRRREELVVQALTAHELFHRDDDYIVVGDEVKIVDARTGRVLEGRQWQLGLHQAVQAKERITITAPHQTMARIGYQQFFQMYERLSGMTGTAWEVRNEIWRSYRMPVVRIPPHRPVIRRHAPDRILLSRDRKFRAVAERVRSLHAQGAPVLIGTRSVDSSERLSALLHEMGIGHNVLSAVRDEQEAAIVAAAGQPGAVTVATNMAGRGTDIHLGKGVAEKGGLTVIATERHESGRVDRQLYGRAGRQGDPGRAETFVALDDELVVEHGLGWLRRLCLAIGPAAGPLGLHRLLWRHAQHNASKRQMMTREMSSRFNLWFDRALYYENR